MAGVKRLQRKSFSANDDIINTSPAKWPGNLDTCISSVGSQKLVSLILTFFRRDKKLNNFR